MRSLKPTGQIHIIVNRRNENILSAGQWPQTWFSPCLRLCSIFSSVQSVHKYIRRCYTATTLTSHDANQHFCCLSSRDPHTNTPIITHAHELLCQQSSGIANGSSLENKNQNQKIVLNARHTNIHAHWHEQRIVFTVHCSECLRNGENPLTCKWV